MLFFRINHLPFTEKLFSIRVPVNTSVNLRPYVVGTRITPMAEVQMTEL